MNNKFSVFHGFFSSFMVVLFLYLWSVSVSEKTGRAMIYAAILFLALTALIMTMIYKVSYYQIITNYIEALVKMDNDLRNALAFSVPSLRLIAQRGKVQTLFADTHATSEHIHRFLIDSTKTQTGKSTTPPKRDWHTADRPAWAWQEIYDWLLAKKMVSSFATGPDSYEYIGTAYQNLAVYFLTQPVQNLDTAPRVYGSDVEDNTGD